jgi:hypothetical protein
MSGHATLPTTTATCPEFHEGMATIMSAGIMRSFQIYIDDAAAAAGRPLRHVLVWNRRNAAAGRTRALCRGLKRIKDAGGVVVAPVHVSTGFFLISDDDRTSISPDGRPHRVCEIEGRHRREAHPHARLQRRCALQRADQPSGPITCERGPYSGAAWARSICPTASSPR